MFEYLNTILATNTMFLIDLLDEAQKRLIDLIDESQKRHIALKMSGFRTVADNKEMILLEEKIDVCLEAVKKAKANGIVSPDASIDMVNKLIEYMSSRDGTLKA